MTSQSASELVTGAQASDMARQLPVRHAETAHRSRARGRCAAAGLASIRPMCSGWIASRRSFSFCDRAITPRLSWSTRAPLTGNRCHKTTATPSSARGGGAATG